MTARALALCLAIAVAAPACGDDAPPTGADTDTAQVVDADPDTGPAPDTTSDPDTSALPDADAGTDTDPVVAVDGAGDGHPPSCAVDADCDDGLACTVDRCTEARHCAWSVAAAACLVHAQCFAAGDARPGEPCQVCDPAAAPLAWTPRDDGAPCGGDDACTLPGTCSGGVCQVSDLPCDDGNPCTDDVCDPVAGCTSTASAADAPCDDGDPCTTGDRC
ncbi:MAG: hypothetical protein KC635_12125, partial [Myxococcales bacterium]|nr:hypothetical protein [Myxococcales bacterium]